MSIMEAIILAGGFGTRLRHIVTDVPKPMATVAGRPFIEYILNYLGHESVAHAILAVGYKKECIMEYFGKDYQGMQLTYSREDKPLFTGGAIRQALGYCQDDSVFVINGDTYFNVPLKKMQKDFFSHPADISVAIRKMHHFSRYGTVRTDADHWITGFEEKKEKQSGFINGGVYLIKKSSLAGYPEAFSYEEEVLVKQVKTLRMRAFDSPGYFIDIGIPEDYYKAQADFARWDEDG
jgi:D-glycero-alpha-D-manno-heptose 1-phosphate guanylyltransferase